MGHLIFYAHAGSGNHGCEAIVRASAKIIGKPITVFSMNEAQDRLYRLDEAVKIVADMDRPIEAFSAEWFLSRIQTKLTGSIRKEVYYRKKKMLSTARQGDIWFSIGGDNYCYPGTEILAAQNQILSRRGAKTVLWGCSVEPKLIQKPQIAQDLAQYNLITARESISYMELKQVNPNTVLTSDPAFTLKRVDCQIPDGWIEGNMIGINASPLILQSGRNEALVFEAYTCLIETILKETDCGVALIPHVVWINNDDGEVLKRLYEHFKNSGRIVLLRDYNCMELKGYIARCRMFVGARTHATIAAYSSCVPTLVLGYSVKSRGIAKDLFGTEENYVLPVQSLENPKELAAKFLWLMEHEESIRKKLEEIMPAYINRAFLAWEAVKRLF